MIQIVGGRLVCFKHTMSRFLRREKVKRSEQMCSQDASTVDRLPRRTTRRSDNTQASADLDLIAQGLIAKETDPR